MSVPTWQRNESKTEFLYQTYQLNIRLLEILSNKPKKYNGLMNNRIMQASLDALNDLQKVQAIHMSVKTKRCDYEQRRFYIKSAMGNIYFISTTFYILAESVRKHGGEKSDKISKQELDIGTRCNEILRLLKGLEKSDTETFNKDNN